MTNRIKKKVFKLTTLYLLVILLVNFLLKVPITSLGFFALTYDQGRDLLQAASIVHNGNFTLIGPTTGLPGIFYGPYWFYILSLLFFAASGNPQFIGTAFGFFGVVTVVLLYLFLKSTLRSQLLAFLLGFIASLSKMWMFGPTVIWNTSMAPILMIAVFYQLHKLKTIPSKLNFLLLGIFSFLLIDFEFPWGIIVVIFVLLLPILSRKQFFKKQFLFTTFGFLLVLTPRLLFNLRNNFLELNSAVSYLKQPKIYGSELTFPERLIQRLDVLLGNFSRSFTSENKIAGLVLILSLLIITFLIIKYDKKSWIKLREDFILKAGLSLVLVAFVLFSIYRDIVWDYYLIGFPVTCLIIISRLFDVSFRSTAYPKLATWLTLTFLVLLNINLQLLHPFKISWLGDDATYRNQIAVMDYISAQKPQNYYIYAYTPAIFDYPFDYLIYWYTRSGRLQKPQRGGKIFYMIIREANNDRYLKSGWYGDKTRDNTTVIDKKYFTGNFLLEKHKINEN